jgi:glucose/arabinose dehydrogenase
MKMIIRSATGKLAQVFLFISLFVALSVLLIHCKKDDHPATETKVDIQLVADGFVSPVGVVASPDNTGRLFVIDQVGKIWIIDQNGNKVSTPFIDLSPVLVPLNAGSDERGLLGFAFHPQFASNHKFYVYYQLPPRAGGGSWNNLSAYQSLRLQMIIRRI